MQESELISHTFPSVPVANRKTKLIVLTSASACTKKDNENGAEYRAIEGLARGTAACKQPN